MMSDLKPNQYKNPILPGFYPDPSICRVGEDYYLVTSSFAYFPGVPVFHSRDLVHWEQLGHVLERESQLDLDGLGHSEGIFAPTIRYHKGTFYLITTNVPKGGNFIVTTDNPEGPWSDPYRLPDAPGIDPSLFFDDDGKAYYVGTRPAQEGEKYFGNWEIWLQELDLNSMSLSRDPVFLWRGAMRDVIWPEGPHLYKINGYYYLMISEGGTDYYHSVTIARSSAITGPFEGNPGNPILTHRHLGRACQIVNTGHADLVETQNGEWWMVALASRPYGGYYRNLGRETFLIPVIWENGWPVVSPGTGRIEDTYVCPDLPVYSVPSQSPRDDFVCSKLELFWNFIRTPREKFWSLDERPGFLSLKLKPQRINEQACPCFIGRRQQHISFMASTIMEFCPETEYENAGLAVIQNNHFHFRMEVALKDNQRILRLIQCVGGVETEIAKKVISNGQISLIVKACGQQYGFYYTFSDGKLETLSDNVDGRILSTDVAGGFVGTYLGMFACSNGRRSKNKADFDWFEYTGR